MQMTTNKVALFYIYMLYHENVTNRINLVKILHSINHL